MHVHKNIALASKQALDNGKEDGYIDLCIDWYFIINLFNAFFILPSPPQGILLLSRNCKIQSERSTAIIESILLATLWIKAENELLHIQFK